MSPRNRPLQPIRGYSPGNHCRTCEEHLLVGTEQVVAPGYGITKGPLVGGSIVGPARQQRQAAFHALEHRPWWSVLEAGGGQFDRQRQAVEAPTDLGHCRAVFVRQDELADRPA